MSNTDNDDDGWIDTLDWSDLTKALRESYADAARLSARVARLEAALRFYADRDNWIYGEDMDGQTFAVEDCGEKARAALENPS